LTSAETLTLPVGTVLSGDVQLTDTNGEVFTTKILTRIVAEDAPTNRLTG
jgi:hypothetical protein